ncbi:MAG: SagB/ThcOx family dehydrogenase [archaeon]|nr:SagB/ThcOx family dehydrogenase [archaeon]
MIENIAPQHLMNLFHDNQKTQKKKIVDEWGTIHFKEYPRFELIKLNSTKRKYDKVEKLLISRRSKRNLTKKVSLNQLSNILYFSAGICKGNLNTSRRTYPSGGARYPLEIYLIINNSEIDNGLYHYNILENSLEKFPKKISKNAIKSLFFQKFVCKSSIIIIITSVIGRSQIKYGLKSLKFSFIESGHLAQNVMLCAKNMKLNSCAIGGYDGNALEKILEIDGLSEGVIYVISLG